MSNISDAFDAIETVVKALLSDHKQLSDAYDLAENDTQTLNKGFGIALGPGLNPELELSCRLSMRKQIIIPITRLLVAHQLEVDRKNDSMKLLMEDQFLLIKDMEKDPTLNSSNAITSVVYKTDGGVQSMGIEGKNDKWLFINTSFELLYFEDLT